MDRELILKESRECLELGQKFLASIKAIRAYDNSIAQEIEDLITEGDEEFIAINNEFSDLLDELGL